MDSEGLAPPSKDQKPVTTDQSNKLYSCKIQQSFGCFFPQLTTSTVRNDSGYNSFTAQMNNDSYYPQNLGNQQHGHYVHSNYPYDNSSLSNTQYLGPQQPQMMSWQNNSQQHATFQSQHDGRNASNQYNGRPMTHVQKYNQGNLVHY